MADQRANAEITIDVEGQAETDKKREDPGRSTKVEKAVEEHGMVGSTETPTENRTMKDIDGFMQRYIDDMKSYLDDLKKSPEAASGGSGFYRVHRDHRQSPEENLYAPTWANFRDTRNMLMDENPTDDRKNRLRHYYHHLESVQVRNQKKTPEYFLLTMEKDLTTWCAKENEATDFPQLLGLVLSGCFIADLFHKCYWDDVSLKEDPECCHKWVSDLWVDILLVENQIPLFILQDVTKSWNDQDDIIFLNFEKLAYYYFKDFIPVQKEPFYREISEGSNERQFLHLLDLVHQSLLPDRKKHSQGILIRFVWITAPLLVCITAPLLVCIIVPLLCIFICLACIYILLKRIFNALARLCRARSPTQDADRLLKYFENMCNRIPGLVQWYFYKYFRKPQVLVASIPTASRLHQAGVQFRPVHGKGFVVDFNKGVLRLPCLHVRKNTKKFFANLIAWEQCHYEAVKYFINYAILMDYLVNNSKDIEILIQYRVLEHSLPTDEDVATLFNTLGKNLVYTKNEQNREDYDFLPQLSKELNRYCHSRFNVWRGNLMSDYFKSPWSIISVIAALLIIGLTMTETFFSVYSYFRPPK